jgi:beta-lactamase regulating signal transducer with metallopeptidase domain
MTLKPLKSLKNFCKPIKAVRLMGISDLHTFFIYVFFGYFFIFPVVLLCLKVFNIQHPKQRMAIYLLGLAAPFAGFALYHSVLTKRCQAGALPGGLFWQVFDAMCRAGNAVILFLGPLLLIMLIVGMLKALAGTMYLARLRTRAVQGTEQRARVDAVIRRYCQMWRMKVPDVIFTGRAGFAAFAAGLIRPAVVVSDSLIRQLNDIELEGVLVHELVHIRRRDTLTGWLLYTVRDLMIFSPFSVAFMDRYLLERERVCDRETAEALESPLEYAATLLKVWRLLTESSSYRFHTAAGFTGKKKDMELRMLSLLESGDEPDALPGVLFITLLVSLAAMTVLFLGLIC